MNSSKILSSGCTLILACAFKLAPAALELPYPVELFTEGNPVKLQSPAAINDDRYATSVAISGANAAVGAINRVDIFVREEGQWLYRTSLRSPLIYSGNNVPSVALDGDTLAIGGLVTPTPQIPGISKGAVYVFSRDAAGEWQPQATLTGDVQWSSASPMGPYDGFGESLALSAGRLVIGCSREDVVGTYSGAAYVFANNGGVWNREAKLIPDASTHKRDDFFGYAVAIDHDTIVVGAPQIWISDRDLGRAFVYSRNHLGWTEQAMIVARGGTKGANFGRSVAVHADRIAVGANRAAVDGTAKAGTVHLFEFKGSAWTEQLVLNGNPVVQNGSYGASVDLKDGLLAVAAPLQTAYYIYRYNGNDGWDLSYISINPHEPRSHFINQVAIDKSGAGLIAGVMENLGTGGAAYIHDALDYGNVSALQRYLRKLLYYPEALSAAAGNFDPHTTAFRYRHLLYRIDPQDSTNQQVRADFSGMKNHYGAAERDLASAVEAELWKGLAIHPDDPALGHLLLDLYYDRTAAEAILAGNEMEIAENERRENIPAGGYVIDREIPAYQQVLAQLDTALMGYFSLLAEGQQGGHDAVIGYRIFRDLVPTRGLQEATFFNASGDLQTVTGAVAESAEYLFYGYKDLTLLFTLLRDYGQAAHQLAVLLAAQSDGEGRQDAQSLIAQSQRRLLLQGSLLLGMFDALPDASHPSGLANAIAGWSGSLRALASLGQQIESAENLLGYAPDFLMLIQKFTGTSMDIFDTFDVFKAQLDPADSVLRRAVAKLDLARTTYDNFRGHLDQYQQQFNQSTVSYEYRLFQIVGAYPADEIHYSKSTPPNLNPGSELDQQWISIDLARLKITHNQEQINKLAAEVQVEIDRAAAVAQAYIRYGGKQARLVEQIGHILAVQSACSAFATTAGSSPSQLLGGAAMAALQGGAELQTSQLEAQKERLAAEHQAQIVGLDSAARVKTLLLGMRTLAIDSLSAALMLRQELGRMTALYREKALLETRIAEAQQSLAGRYFADPVHRIRAEASLINANLHFDEARHWLFFMLQAYEYKTNTAFIHTYLNRVISRDTFFKLRNADELKDFYDAMVALDSLETLGPTPAEDFFSLREDFMGLKQIYDGNKQPVKNQIDPVTGQSYDAIGLFRVLLARQIHYINAGSQIVLDFNTVREIPAGTFFVGPTFRFDGNNWTNWTKGHCLDKIDYLQIQLPGSHTVNRTQVAGSLTYGGTSFVRNLKVGTFDPADPDRLVGELTAYSSRYWYYDNSVGQHRWRFTEGLTIDGVAMQLTGASRTPPIGPKILEFRERSVAATGWRLIIPLVVNGVTVLNLDELDDIEIYFHHYRRQRM